MLKFIRRSIGDGAVSVLLLCSGTAAGTVQAGAESGVAAAIPQVADVNAWYSETYPAGMHQRNVQMAEAGVDGFVLIVRGGYDNDHWTTWFWRDDGVFGDEDDRTDGLSLNDQAAAILAVNPDAVFAVRWSADVPLAWTKLHPGELQASDKRVRREGSYASRLSAEGRAEMARRVVRYVEAQSWADRVIVYLPFGQDEGTSMLAIQDSLFDQSPAMTREFRRFLLARYPDDAALRLAWNDTAVTRESASVPSEAEWIQDRQAWMHWPEPSATRRYRDYFELKRELLFMQRRLETGAVRETATRPAIIGMDALKQPMSGWLIEDAFEGAGHGMAYRNILLASGSIGVAPLLDDPAIDALVTPADYTARAVGFGWEPEGIGDSLVLRGKTIWVEDDARSWVTGERGTQGAWRRLAECRAGLLRNLAVGASRGFLPYWMNVGQGYFDDPDILAVISDLLPVRQRLLNRDRTETEHAIAMILDDESPLDENFTAGFQNLAVLRQRNDELALSGLPYRIYLLSDLARDDFPRYRAYLLPNLFRLTPERSALIREKLMGHGSIVIFGPGTGIRDEQRLAAAPASDLLGFPLTLVNKQSARRVLVYGGGHPALREVPGPMVYGDSHVYGPILQPAATVLTDGAVELGRSSAWWGNNTAGLVLKEFGRGAAGNGNEGPRGPGDYAVVFSMAVPMPATLLRSLAAYGGACLWSDLGDVVAADGGMLAVHTVRQGTRHLRIPAKSTVTDAVTDDVIAELPRHPHLPADTDGPTIALNQRGIGLARQPHRSTVCQ